jgi:hypothetical protein
VEQNENGLSEVLDSTLIVALGLALTVITVMLMFGVLPMTEKTAYLVPQFGIVNVSGHTAIAIFDRGGEPVYFNGSSLAKYKADLYVDTPARSYRAVPAPSLAVFKPGETVYAYYTGSGFVLTNTLSGLTFPSLPAGNLAVRFMDTTSGVIIAKEDLVKGAATVTTTSTTAVKTTATTTTATTTTTTTTTTPLPTLTAGFTWGPAGASNTIKFSDASTGTPTSWSWNFGDGSTGSGKSVNNHYSKTGTYQVTLTVTRSPDGATSSITKTITV